MKKMAELMEELGFRPDGSDEVKKAFIKNLIRQANASEFSRPKIEADPVENKETKDIEKWQQISLFDKKISG